MSVGSGSTADAALVEEVERSLADVREGVNRDGYDFRVEVGTDDMVSVSLVAQSDACEECLVPKEVMVTILEGCLPEAALSRGWRLVYPAEVGPTSKGP